MNGPFFHTGLQVSRTEIQDLLNSRYLPFGEKFYVSRNKGTPTGDGSSAGDAFLTFTEAVTATNTLNTNALFPGRGRNTTIFIDEGWYAELPQILTASDVRIVVVAPGYHDSTVLYGVPVAGVFSGVSGGPALTLTGDNCTVQGLGVYTSDPLYASIQNGASMINSTGNKFIGGSCIRDVADGSLGGILDYGADGTLIEDWFFSTSCKDFGVQHKTNGDTNPVNPVVKNCRFVGTPIGVDNLNAHNSLTDGCIFQDDTSDRADVVDYPVVITGSASGTVSRCYSALAKADIVTGTGTIVDIGNYGSDSST